MRRTTPLLLCCGFIGACGGGGSSDSHDRDDAGPPDDGGTSEPLSCAVPDHCPAWNVREHCDDGVWTEQSCPGGCFAGECSTTLCADECSLGDSGPRGSCALYDMASSQFVTAIPATSLVDRARDYDQRLPDNQLAGGVVDILYTDESLGTVERHEGLGDSALWSGTALAASAWRLMATGSADAAARVEQLADTLHLWLNVSDVPGYLSRFAMPAGEHSELFDCNSRKQHCDAPFDGQRYDWKGGTSRDQYTGVLLGYTMAYRTSPSDRVRRQIRDDVVELTQELMKKQTVPVRIDVGNLPVLTTIDAENVILIPSEMEDGRVRIEVDTSHPDDSELEEGLREFMPDLAVALRQIPGLGWLPDIPRSSSAIILGAIFSLALDVADDDPAMAAARREISAYYESHIADWLTIAERAGYDGTCGSGYYAVHFAFVSAYVWAQLEADPARATRIREHVVGNLWQAVQGHKNSYFAFLRAATAASPDASAVSSAIAQLSQYQPGPRVFARRDNVDNYPHDPECTFNDRPAADRSTAVDVGDRVIDGFIWQRDPWGLYADGNPRMVFPGVDYVAAYWAARAHRLIEDDRPGTCTRWRSGP